MLKNVKIRNSYIDWVKFRSMKEHRLKIIILLMTISIIGLLSVQFYWIKNLIRVEDERFHRMSTDAMIRTAHNIEHEEAAKSVIKRISHRDRNDFKFRSTKKRENQNTRVFVFDTSGKHTKEPYPKAKYKYEIRREIDSDAKKTKVEIRTFPLDEPDNQPLPFGNPEQFDTVISNHKKLVENVVTEIMEVNMNKKIEDRVTINNLNGLLSKEFRNSGINGDFYFGVNQVKKDSLTLLKKGTDINELKRSDLRTMLFPSELFSIIMN